MTLTEIRQPAIAPSVESPTASSVSVNPTLKEQLDQRIKKMGLDPETMFLDRRGKRWKYRSQTAANALDRSSRPARP